MKRYLIAGLSAAIAASAIADTQASGEHSEWSFKLSAAYYDTARETAATDVNLRANHGPHALWLGDYHRGNEFAQTRIGYEGDIDTEFGRLVPSMQLATHGFVGGSLNAEIGKTNYLMLGYGLTNAHDYYNLNFDPNDSITVGLGTRLVPHANLALFTTRDIRLHTGQTVTHALARYQASDDLSLILDLAAKRGREDAEAPRVTGESASLTCDYREVFVRIARDNKVNYSANNQTRISLGLRF